MRGVIQWLLFETLVGDRVLAVAERLTGQVFMDLRAELAEVLEGE